MRVIAAQIEIALIQWHPGFKLVSLELKPLLVSKRQKGVND
jgi:hypothetical protein